MYYGRIEACYQPGCAPCPLPPSSIHLFSTPVFRPFPPPARANKTTQTLRKVFSPVVTGVTVFLIGAALVGTGFKYWGGGVYCGDNVLSDDPPSCK